MAPRDARAARADDIEPAGGEHVVVRAGSVLEAGGRHEDARRSDHSVPDTCVCPRGHTHSKVHRLAGHTACSTPRRAGKTDPRASPALAPSAPPDRSRSEEHTSEL